MSTYPTIVDSIKLTELKDLIKIHFYIKMIEKKVDITEFSDRELSILAELYIYGGLSSKKDLQDFTDLCSSKGLTKNSVQSVRNILSKARILGVVKRPKENNWFIIKDYLFKIDSKNLIFKYIIHNVEL